MGTVPVTTEQGFHFRPSVTANAALATIQFNRFKGTSGVGDGTFDIFLRTYSTTGVLEPVIRVNAAFSPVPVDPNFDHGIACGYIGDYNQIIPQGLTLLHAYSDNRRNTPLPNNPDVFFSRS